MLLAVLSALSGSAQATTFTTPVDADYGDITNSVYLSKDDFPAGAPAAVLCLTDSYTTALAATVLAHAAGGPLLLTSAATLSPSATNELRRLEVATVYVVGLPPALVDALRTALPDLPPEAFVVLDGCDQYQNAALMAAQVKTLTGQTPERVFLVPGDVYGSSLAAAAVAAAQDWPLLLTPQAGPLPAPSAQAIQALGVTRGVRVDTSVEVGVAGFVVEKTILGTTSPADDPGSRYSEALEVAQYAVSQGWASWSDLAIGEEQGGSVPYSTNFPDNVLLATHIARAGGAYVLARSTGLLPALAAALRAHGHDIEHVAFMRPDYSQILSGAWSFAAIRQVKSLNAPRVTALSRSSGPLSGGGPLTVTGTGFSGAVSLTLGKTELPASGWHVDSDTSLTIAALPAATQTGPMEVLVTNYWHVSPSSPADVYLYTPASGPDLTAMAAVTEAIKYLGKPYIWAGASPSVGFDCSGLTMYVYNQFTSLTGVTLPHKSTYQAGYGTPVAKEDLLPGDLVFFGSPVSHVGMYVGNGLMVNAPRSGDLVCIEDVFRTNYTSARRLISPYVRLEQTDSLLAYTGDWNLDTGNSSASGGSYGYADDEGATVTVSFTGTYLRWISKKSPAYGLARVSLDGKDQGTVDLYRPYTSYQEKVWDTGPLEEGLHTVTISWTGTATGGDTNIGLDAFDALGAFVPAQAASVPVRYEDTDRRVLYTGLWDNLASPAASGACLRTVSAAGQAQITFQGTSVAWVGMKGPASGLARVSLDGKDQGTVDLYSASARYDQTLWSITGLLDGPHTLVVAWTGSKNPASTGATISLDAFAVTGTLLTPAGLTRSEQTEELLSYTGTWYTFSTTSASAGSYRRARSAAAVTVHFSGTYLSWVATAGTTLGRARVSLDGGPTQTVDLARSAVAYQQSVWASGLLTEGEHTVVISWDASADKYVSVDAFDVLGTLTDGTVPPAAAVRYEQTDSRIIKSGSWYDFPKPGLASAGSYGRSATPGASATISFTGTRLDWIGMKGTTTGIAQVYLDGEQVSSVDLSATVASYQVTLWSSGPLSDGPHTVKIVRSDASAPGKYVTLDAVDIWGAIQ